MTMPNDSDTPRQVGFYLDPFGPLLAAMIRAEGGEHAFVHALQCGLPETRTFDEALARACKTVRNRAVAYAEFVEKPLLECVRAAGTDPWTGEDAPRRLRVSDDFIEFLGARWAPIGVNDPQGLNRNWTRNVQTIYAQLLRDGDPAPEATA